MIRRISTKWMLAVLLAVVTPFLGYAFFVDQRMAELFSGDVVRQYLLSMAADLADRIDDEIEERRWDADVLAHDRLLEWYLRDYDQANVDAFHMVLEAQFSGLVWPNEVYDLIVAVDKDGHYRVSSVVDREGRLLSDEMMQVLRNYDYQSEGWFQDALEYGKAIVDQHRSALLPSRAPPGTTIAEDYQVGFAHRVGPTEESSEPAGVVYLLMNWKRIQDEVSNYGVRRLEAGNDAATDLLVAEDIYDSSYAWIWKSDADTILAHPDRELYGQRVSQPPISLPAMVEAARSGKFGMYPDYVFRDEGKKAAFKHCRGPEEGGFGWVVGVGVDASDIYAPVRELSHWLYGATAVTLVAAVLLTAIIARRTTRPILELRRHTERIAHGDLGARIDVRSNDELGDLARAFNQMTAELSENRAQLVRAEKDAAWREMARQVAHEIKNPLTPISLAVGLLKRARSEGEGEFERIFDRTLDMIQRQVIHMRDIAKDFYSLAGNHKHPREFEAEPVLQEVLELNEAWAHEHGVRVRYEHEPVQLFGDPDELRRVMINLVSNALEAMPSGGELHVSLRRADGQATILVEDSGPGIPADVRERLFVPYFTTRSSGTGLGLAIVRRIVEDMGGSVTLDNRPGTPGAVARIELPCR